MRGCRVLLVIGVAAFLHPPRSFAEAPDLGAAASFAVLGKTVRSNGASVITGNVGGDRVSGFPPAVVQLGQVLQKGLRDAERDFAAAAASLSCSPTILCMTSQTTRFDGDAGTIWLIRTNGPLTIAPNTTMVIVGGGDPNHVYWLASGDVTIGAGTSFIGNVLTPGDITVRDGVNVNGRLLSGGTVTLTNDRISLCCAPITLQPQSPLRPATVGMPYHVDLTASGGVEPYTFRVTSGIEPPGLTVLQGTPSMSGTYKFTITATDARGCTGTADYELHVEACPLELAPSLDGLLPRNGVPPYTCTLTGTLPSGMSLQDCAIVGSPAPGACSSVVTVDAKDAKGCTGSRTYTICVPLTFSLSSAFSPSTGQTPVVGKPYQPVVIASCGAVVIPPASPPVPQTPDPFSYTVTAADPVAACGTSTHTFDVTFVCATDEVLPDSLPDGTVGVLYDVPLPPPHTYVVTGAPPGVSPLLTGTPTQPGPYSITITATDVFGCTTTRTYPPVTIACPTLTFTPTPPTLPHATVNVPYTLPIQATPNALGAYTYKWTQLPPGFSSLLSGLPTTVGAYDFTVTATDPVSGCSGSVKYTLIVDPAPVITPGAAIPTLAQWGVVLMVLLLGAVAARRVT